MLATTLVIALLAASSSGLEIDVDAARAPPLADGRRVVLVVTARNTGPEDLVFLPGAIAVRFSGPGVRRQPYDEGPPLPPLWREARMLRGGASTRVELVATGADAMWQVPAGGMERANWFLPGRGSCMVTVTYAVPPDAIPRGTSLPPGVVWTGEISARPVTFELPP